ncbi:hypothetical protein BST46_26805 [Mycobacterium timonense]|uniref:Secreted protein n=1 Tax=Mycobacterium timonense TaxID=701043 RepID=A0ABX3TE10_9MYCO|nr:hypothetical protein BST46_26805 [Mycobacterium timonense]
MTTPRDRFKGAAGVSMTLAAAALVVVAPTSMPPAAAAPQQFPDLGSYSSVNADDYTTYHSYMTAGVQFAAPGGYRCRMSFTHKQNGAHMQCWGSLPGTSFNHVGLDYLGGATTDGDAFSDVDLSQIETVPPGPGVAGGTINPQDYKPLPPHSKVTYTDGPLQTCAVDSAMTACETTDEEFGQQHGFVLSPAGSWTF